MTALLVLAWVVVVGLLGLVYWLAGELQTAEAERSTERTLRDWYERKAKENAAEVTRLECLLIGRAATTVVVDLGEVVR